MFSLSMLEFQREYYGNFQQGFTREPASLLKKTRPSIFHTYWLTSALLAFNVLDAFGETQYSPLVTKLLIFELFALTLQLVIKEGRGSREELSFLFFMFSVLRCSGHSFF